MRQHGVGLSWLWAPLQSYLGHDAPEFTITRREAAQVQAYSLPRSHLVHGTDEVWRQLGHGSWNSVPQCQNNGTIDIVEDSLQYRNYGRFEPAMVWESLDDFARPKF